MEKLEVKFYDSVDDELIRFAVIAARYEGKWVLCRHRERSTYEIPGGHREQGEKILETAQRELYEETGAVEFEIKPVCVYSVTGSNSANPNGKESYGMLYYAAIHKLGRMPETEIAETILFDTLPENLTYPFIQPKLMQKVTSLISKE